MAARGQNLLTARHRARVRRFAAQRVLLAFDFDGTLAPIVADAERAVPRASTLRLLRALCARFPVAVISGRGVADLRTRLPIPTIECVGNHGAEPAPRMATVAREVARWLAPLRARLGAYPGIWVEDKRYSVTVHYRGVPDPDRARRIIRAAITGLPGRPRATDGHFVVNLLSHSAPDKGDALRRLQGAGAFANTLFVGDDTTDEDAFARQRPDRDLGVRVGRAPGTRAPFYIPSQRAVDELLRRFIACRPDPGPRSPTSDA